jgi:predicted AAA+ superfamily ATPase
LSKNYTENLRELLKEYNPWWSDNKWYEKDEHILEYQQGAFSIISRLYYHIINNLTIPNKYGIVTIRGPRRSGKTTLIKLVIKYLMVEKNINPSNIFYISLDYGGLKDIGLFDILKVIADIENYEKYVFLDEASMYEKWALELKNLVDVNIVSKGRLKIIATGSHSMDLVQAAALLRDRQGELANEFNLGGNLLYTPLRFSEFVEGVNKEVSSLLSEIKFRKHKNRFNILKELSEGIVSNELEDLYNKYFITLDQLFKNYLIHGGYPKAIKEFYEQGKINNNLYSNLAELLIKDSEKSKLEPQILKNILAYIVEPKKLSTPLGSYGIRLKDLKKKEIRKYLEYLFSTWTFFLSYPERKDKTCEPNIQDYEHSKLYVLDPFIFYSLYSYINNIPNPFEYSIKLVEDQTFSGLMVESIIASHLLLSQQLFEHVTHVEYERVLMYSRRSDKDDHEIDFVLCVTKNNERYRFIIESKYRKGISEKSSRQRIIVLTKDTFYFDGKNKRIYIPTPIFLMLF